MKRILLAVIVLALALPAMRQAEAGVDVSIDFFYDSIDSDGSWVELADYGYCWQPNVAVSNVKWRPYSDGYWAFTDVGWTWISYEDFGWATYHYGRWVRVRDRGWYWVPGREWGPAWVSWRTGGDYVGWAPLPPRGGDQFVSESNPINGRVDIEFDIGPSCYNFVDVRYIGEPVLRERIIEPQQNIIYITNTVNVTNISYANSVVYNYGPDYNTLSQYSTRPIRRMTLEREANVDLSVAARTRGLTKVQGDKLIVAVPPTLQKSPASVAPKTVKEKISKPTVERGWNDVTDPKAQADLKQKMKSENPKNIPPPSIKPRDEAGAPQSPSNASPAVPAHPAATTVPTKFGSPAMAPDTGKNKDKRLMNVSPMPTAAAPVKPASSPVTTPPGKPRKEPLAKPPGLSPPSSNVSGTAPAPTPHKPNDRRQGPSSSLATSPDGTPFREAPIRDKEAKKDKRAEKAPETMPPARQPSEPLTEKAPQKPKIEPPPNRQAPADIQPKKPLPPERVAPPSREAPPEAPRKHPAPPERTLPPAPGPAANAPKPEAPHKQRAPDKKAGEPVPSPSH